MGQFGLKIRNFTVFAFFCPLVLFFVVCRGFELFRAGAAAQAVQKFLFDSKCFDVRKPPVAFLILDEIGYEFTEFDTSLKPKEPNDLLHHR